MPLHPIRPYRLPLPVAADAGTSSASPPSVADGTAADRTLASGSPPQAGQVSVPAIHARRKRPALPDPTRHATARRRIEPGILPAAPAVSPRTLAHLQRQARINTAMDAALRQFSMDSQTPAQPHRDALVVAATNLEPPPDLSGATDAALRQQQLHAIPEQIQTARRQDDFYLEQQVGQACAQHALNAMMGGPMVSLSHFAEWQARRVAQEGRIPASVADIAADMLAHGVFPDIVRGTLETRGTATQMYVHYSRFNDAQGRPALDLEQARALQDLSTDRLLLQVDRYVDNGTASHYVAFRKHAGQWVLLDSLEAESRFGVGPFDYMVMNGIYQFTAIWPQEPMQEQVSADARVEAPQEPSIRRRTEIQKKFMAVLKPYAEGKPLKECEEVSKLGKFRNYLLHKGGLGDRGKSLYNGLSKQQKREVNQAIAARQTALLAQQMETPSTMEKFMAGLKPYAEGKRLTECQELSKLACFHQYLSDKEGLGDRGEILYSGLPQKQRTEVDQAIAARQTALLTRQMETPSTMEKFMAGLTPYAAGKSLAECQQVSKLASFDKFLSDKEGLGDKGKRLYSELPQEQKTEVDQAIVERQTALLARQMETPSTMEKFMAGLTPYAEGKRLTECQELSNLTSFHNFLSYEGGLKERGKKLYEQLPQERKEEVDRALRLRTMSIAKINIAPHQFLAAIHRFSTSSDQIKTIEQATKIKKNHLGLLLHDTGLTEAGDQYVKDMFELSKQKEIHQEISIGHGRRTLG